MAINKTLIGKAEFDGLHVGKVIVSGSTIMELVAEMSQVYRVTIGEIMGKTRRHRVALARHAVFYLASKRLKYSTVRIGREMNRDHSTVINGIRNITNLVAKIKRLEALEQEMKKCV